MREVTVDIGGLSCGACVKRVNQALVALNGVVACEVALAANGRGTARLSYNEDKTDLGKIEETVRRAGYAVEPG